MLGAATATVRLGRLNWECMANWVARRVDRSRRLIYVPFMTIVFTTPASVESG
jgi:hypothetical protein